MFYASYQLESLNESVNPGNGLLLECRLGGVSATIADPWMSRVCNGMLELSKEFRIV